LKIYLCGLCQDNLAEIEELTSVYNHFDGLLFVDGGSKDGTVALLEGRKKEGKIFHREWSNDFDLQNNIWLRGNVLKHGDWFVIRDASERLSDDFCKELPALIKSLKEEGVQSCWWQSKFFMGQYYDDQFFNGSVHWGVQGARAQGIDLSQRYLEPDNHTWNTRNDKRSKEDWIKHHVKYIWTYGRSNHLLLGREEKQEEFQQLEQERQWFRYTLFSLGFDNSVESLNVYLDHHEEYDPKIYEVMLRNPYINDYIDLRKLI
jgi:hypothetical protein